MKTLHLSLKSLPFEVMISGEKTVEIRKPTNWIKSRLVGKSYDQVKFVNGYGAARPYFVVPYLGYDIAQADTTITYSNGLVVEIKQGDYLIHLGEVVETKYWKKERELNTILCK